MLFEEEVKLSVFECLRCFFAGINSRHLSGCDLPLHIDKNTHVHASDSTGNTAPLSNAHSDWY